MKTTKALAALSLGFALMIATLPAGADSSATVGDFIVRLAKTKNLDSADPVVARDSLAAVGVRLPADLVSTQPLTEGDVSRIARFAGLSVTTSRPGQPFSRLQVDRFFTSFQGELGQSGTSAGARACDPAVENCENPGNPDPDPQAPFDPFAKGQGKKKGKAKQPQTQVDPI